MLFLFCFSSQGMLLGSFLNDGLREAFDVLCTAMVWALEVRGSYTHVPYTVPSHPHLSVLSGVLEIPCPTPVANTHLSY